MKRALITGITGQDGSYLSELLIEKGYEVYGLMRRKSTLDFGNITHLKGKVKLLYGDLIDISSLIHAIEVVEPDEVYNLASQSYVATSWEQPIVTSEINGMGVVNLLEAIRIKKKDVKFYQASSSEMFGHTEQMPQTENTPFYPQNPYAIAKTYAHQMVKAYRDTHGMYCCAGILFNHESERRGEEFVTRKITGGIAKIMNGKLPFLVLGNIDSKRDWGYAKDYVRAMWLMLQQETPTDYVVASGQARTVREFVETAFRCVGITVQWCGSNADEIGLDATTGNVLVRINSCLFRPADDKILVGDFSRAKRELNWQSEVSFDEMVRCMVEHDLRGGRV